MIVILDAKIGR